MWSLLNILNGNICIIIKRKWTWAKRGKLCTQYFRCRKVEHFSYQSFDGTKNLTSCMRKLCVWGFPIWETLYSIKCKFQAKSTELINNIDFLYEVLRKYHLWNIKRTSVLKYVWSYFCFWLLRQFLVKSNSYSETKITKGICLKCMFNADFHIHIPAVTAEIQWET